MVRAGIIIFSVKREMKIIICEQHILYTTEYHENLREQRY